MSLLRFQAELHRAKHQDWWDIVEDTEAHATTEAGTSLLSLPTELHFEISKYLHWWDIYSLRLTCRLMDYVLPPLRDHGNLPSIELSIEKRFSIPAVEELLVHRSAHEAIIPRYITSTSGTAAPLIDSFYMENQGYYICFGCGSIKDDKEWYEWRANDKRLYEWPENLKKGFPWKAWQRCGNCDEVLQELLPQRCPQHEKTRRHHICRTCGPSMLRIGLRHSQRKKQVRKRPLCWL